MKIIVGVLLSKQSTNIEGNMDTVARSFLSSSRLDFVLCCEQSQMYTTKLQDKQYESSYLQGNFSQKRPCMRSIEQGAFRSSAVGPYSTIFKYISINLLYSYKMVGIKIQYIHILIYIIWLGENRNHDFIIVASLTLTIILNIINCINSLILLHYTSLF